YRPIRRPRWRWPRQFAGRNRSRDMPGPAACIACEGAAHGSAWRFRSRSDRPACRTTPRPARRGGKRLRQTERLLVGSAEQRLELAGKLLLVLFASQADVESGQLQGPKSNRRPARLAGVAASLPPAWPLQFVVAG